MPDRLHRVIDEQHSIVDRMVCPNGAVLASGWGHYKAHWIRDGLYALEAYKHLGIHKRLKLLANAPMNIFHRYDSRIHEGVRRRPQDDYKFIHSRYSAFSLEELPEKWGHNQLDMLGLFLYEISDLTLRFHNVFHECDIGRTQATIVLNSITRYLNTMKWWEFPDYGVWEEGPDLHSSSLGAVVGGLEKLEEVNRKYPALELFFELDQLDKGRQALNSLLPRESRNDENEKPNRNRACDLAQLSLIWPFDVLDRKQEDTVLRQIEEQLVREKGVIRYAFDPYYNGEDERLQSSKLEDVGQILYYRDEDASSFPATRAGSEAQWPLGFGWLSIVYSHLADKRGGDEADTCREKARHYWERLLGAAVHVKDLESGYIPELYSRGVPNGNTPLTWSSAFAIVASVRLAESPPATTATR